MRHPALDGLGDNELAAVFALGNMRKVAIGDVLLSQALPENTVFLVLEGSARVLLDLEGQSREIAVLRRGSYFGEFSSDQESAESFVVISCEPLVLFPLNESGLKTLPARVQAGVYKGLARLAEIHSKEMMIATHNAAGRESHYADRLRTLLCAKGEEYAGSPMIKSILKAIPRLPVFASKLPALLLDEKTSPREVADLSKLDPALVGLVLKTVNSAYYGFSNRISDFNHAVMLLGFNQVYQIVMNEGIGATMPKGPVFRDLQFHSVIVSYIAFELTQLRESSRGAAISTLGLLHDIGKSVTLLLKSQHAPMSLLIDLLDPAKLGALLLKEWNLPDSVCRSVEYQSYPEFLPPGEIPEDIRANVSYLYVAHLCSEILQGKQVKQIATSFAGDYLQFLRLEQGSIADLAMRRIFPALRKKLNSLPQDVRAFLSKDERTRG